VWTLRLKKLIQTIVMSTYSGLVRTGLFETHIGKWIFSTLYGVYKRRFEATSIESIHPWVKSGTTVVDVGANIGFFTIQFARWAGPNGRILAIEPEAENLRLLRCELDKAGIASNVEVLEGVAAETPGTLRLTLNPHHPADHRIGETGIQVRAWTIDEIMTERGWPTVSFIKIDVQGAEVRVLRGAQETLKRYHPALFIEVDDDALAKAGASADVLFDEVEAYGYRFYDPAHAEKPLTRVEASVMRQALGYADYLCRV
jgi:FkbM family methyltransferase